ncbi:MAG: coenzyme F420-0:L-glutamate ligase [Patescibacteria group bacterium]|nr:coenzyme F420-0:L-glutamate ligase [Patescibacteria group bacterium]MDE1944312.1 coenzyme F420-0:L-glutamate ligase [Patescibacteria group bacterium]MDE1945303.1 coenzyme F420-0:L-glutamate ligase [Patescibacteria group bacterium]MDE2057880.1 coenzyme F420-0:L-glutamate ligase [Patescibacteria group bacterium]
MAEALAANPGKTLEREAAGARYLRLPVKTRLIEPGEDLMALLEEYVAPHLAQGDILFVSEKIVCICQNRIVNTADVKTSWLARLLAKRVRNYAGTPQFRGLGHGTAPAMQLLIEEAGYPRVLFAAAVSALSRNIMPGAFYYLVGKRAKSIDCPMSWTIEEYKHKTKKAPADPDGVARRIKERFGPETVVVDANYRGAFSLGKSSRSITERFVREVLADNPAGQDSELTPFLIVRKAA